MRGWGEKWFEHSSFKSGCENAHWEGGIWANSVQKWLSEPCRYLGEECVDHRRKQRPRRWEGSLLGMCEEQRGGRRGQSRVSMGRSIWRWGQRDHKRLDRFSKALEVIVRILVLIWMRAETLASGLKKHLQWSKSSKVTSWELSCKAVEIKLKDDSDLDDWGAKGFNPGDIEFTNVRVKLKYFTCS